MPDVVCTACGCLCDDIELELEGDRIVEARHACPTGRDAFLAYQPAEGPPCRIDGRPATIEEGIERAASLLAGSRYPLIFSLDRATTETQRAAASLAEAIAGVIDAGDGPTLDALRTVGEVTATLGEVRNRADLIVVWRADPLESHPRLFSRYALEPVGEFVPAGRSGRFCVIIDTRETRSTREAADQVIRINEGSEFEAIAILRAMVAGVPIDDAEAATGVPAATWRELSERMRGCRYGALFYGTVATDAMPVTHGLHALIRALNETARFVCLPLFPGGGNAVGARNVLAWRLGFPGAVSLVRGYPRPVPGELTAASVLERGEVDAALLLPRMRRSIARAGGPRTSRPYPAASCCHRRPIATKATPSSFGQPPSGSTRRGPSTGWTASPCRSGRSWRLRSPRTRRSSARSSDV